MILHTDGGARGNPGPAAIGAVISDKLGRVINTASEYVGETTNNVAEYKALLMGLNLALESNIAEITCYLDSELVVKQLNGVYRVKKDDLIQLHAKVKELSKKFSVIKFEHIRREFNSVADGLVNQVLDARQK